MELLPISQSRIISRSSGWFAHGEKNALNYAVQILLNMYCNDHMNYNDGTCCSSPESVTMLQLITFSILGVSCAIAFAMIIHRKWMSRKLFPNILEDEEGDSVKNKEQESQFTQVLHRDQTNEWKGWMQLLILIYHMTGASHVLPIYMHIRVLVTSYLFLSGFGHFTYFYHYGDFGFYRFWRVIFRLNFLVVVLCLCMNRPYQFYYFVPFGIFLVCCNVCYRKVCSKVTAPAAEGFFEKIFVTRPWKALFVTTDDSIKEWWFRWKIDRYSVAFGMLFAFGLQLLKQYHILDDKNRGNLFSKGVSLTAASAALVGIGCLLFFCRNKLECNEVHPYISFVPILSYLILRNVSSYLRTKYSMFFAWFGNISLELFIAQYHIWLAADTHGVLVLVPVVILYSML
ncbi:n-acetylneuraminate 9-O-acetyltransferase [Caerostris extrusa]|uniref:N-acetylneuraminate 9-O-acetyltransferase n=1 Tax=Caerostris extrusa TaxID=172846 RepID=A0AAV4W3R2_CAEEX|nr:n-acetylneuraminate 9-O-acetyltransferase [Caerostris extrusa]